MLQLLKYYPVLGECVNHSSAQRDDRYKTIMPHSKAPDKCWPLWRLLYSSFIEVSSLHHCMLESIDYHRAYKRTTRHVAVTAIVAFAWRRSWTSLVRAASFDFAMHPHPPLPRQQLLNKKRFSDVKWTMTTYAKSPSIGKCDRGACVTVVIEA